MKNKKTTELAKASARKNDSDDKTCEKESGLLYCPEVGCIKSIQHFSSLGKHLWLYALEQETLYDKAKTQLNWSITVMPFCKWRRRCILREQSPAQLMWWALTSAIVTERTSPMLRKTILLKYFKRENTPAKRLILLLFQRQCEELSSAMAPISFKRTTSSQQIVGLFFLLNSEKFNFQHSRWRFWRTWGKRRERHPRAYWSRN